jgi:iron complex outermembrane receptor protein
MTNLFRARWLAGTALPLVLLMTGAQSQAQNSPNGVTANGFETVIVDARKRSEDAQQVPIAITTYGQDDVDKLDIKTIEDLRYTAPSVHIAPTTFRQDTLNVTIRGQRDFDSSSGQSVMSFDPAAAVYIDGVYLARPVGLTGALFDVDSLTVLKGPQGTLVGRNSTGGAILYTTREPTAEYGGYLRSTIGDYGRGELQGALNLPLTDNLYFRAAFNVTAQDGYIENFYRDPATGFFNDTPAMGSNRIAANLSLKWIGPDDLEVLLRANIAAERYTGVTYNTLGFFPGSGNRFGRPAICNIPGACIGFTDMLGHRIEPYYSSFSPAGVGPVNTDPRAYNSLLSAVNRASSRSFWSTEQTVSNRTKGHYQTVSATVRKTIGDVEVNWLTAYRWWDNLGTSIGRGLPYDTAHYEYQVPDYKSYQSELTLNGQSLGGRIHWTAGLFYFHEDSPNDGGLFYLFIPNSGFPQPVSGRQITLQDGGRNSQRNSSYAAYGQATYAITPDTRLTAGVRYTYDERYALIGTRTVLFPATAGSSAGVPNGVFDPSPVTYNGITYTGQTRACTLTNMAGVLKPLASCDSTVDVSFDKPTWTLALDHDLAEGVMVYATTRSGYRSGAINSTAINPAVTVAAPENVQDYEIGLKADWTLWGMPLRTNLAAYYTDYRDIQTLVTLPNVTIATTNTGGVCDQAAYNANACLAVTNDNVTLNAKAARIQGVEWDLGWKPIPELSLTFAGSFLDARYTDFTFSPPPGYLLPSGGTTLTGSPFPLPAWQTNATASYATGLKDLFGLPVDDLVISGHYYWQSRYLANMTGFDPSQRTSSYGMFNLRAELFNIGGKNFNFAFFMNNVLNTPACQPEYNGVLNSAPNASFGIANTAGVLQCLPLPPRMYGVQLSYRF